jgi:uncharacterized protein YbjQ (UPF0145 family)
MDLDTTLQMLKSINATMRLEACEQLCLASQSSPAIIAALENATRDRNAEVAKAARKALDKLQGVTTEEDKVLLTTTPTIEGYRVESYLGVISAEVVLGTGFLSELGASLADLLGSRASKFQDKLKEAREVTLRELRTKALELQANAVVGVDLDYSVLSNNMLMVVANGTAARITPIVGSPSPNPPTPSPKD